MYRHLLWLLLLVPGPAWASDPCALPPEVVASRPAADGPTEVKVGVYVIDVLAIDDVEQAFTADFLLALSWHDPRLAAEARGETLAGCRLGVHELWHPDVHVLNQRSLTDQLNEPVQIDEAGRVLYRRRFFGQLSAPVDLREFPFDRQKLPLAIASRYGPDDVVFAVDESRSGRREPFTIPGWTLDVGEVWTGSERIVSLDREIARLDAHLLAHREAGFFLWKVLFPLGLIAFMAWTVFWIDPTSLPPQVGVSTAAVLTLIAFQFSFIHILPRVSYLTRIDKFVLGSSILVFLALGEAILAGRLAARGQESLARRIDLWARFVYPVLFGLIVVATLVI